MRMTHVIDHAAREAPDREIVTRWADGSETRTDWAGIRRDAKKMAQALQALGLKPGDKVASLAMNHARHLVSWFGVAGMGGVLHTCNPRLFEDQLEYIVNHAEDKVMIYDAAFQPIVDKMKDKLADGRALHLLRQIGRTHHQLRGLDRRAGWRFRMGRWRRARSLHDLLHQRHHGQSQGRAVRAPLDAVARDGGLQPRRSTSTRPR